MTPFLNKHGITADYLRSRGINHGLCFTGALIKEDPLEFSRCTNIAAERRAQVLLHEDFIDDEALLELTTDSNAAGAAHHGLFVAWQKRCNDLTLIALQHHCDVTELRERFWESICTKLRPHLHYYEVAKCRARMNAWEKERAE